MTPRERVLKAIAHQEGDRVPWDFWAKEETFLRLQKHLGLPDQESVLKAFDVDLRVVRGPSYAGLDLKEHEDGSVEDLWGVRRKVKHVKGEGYAFTYKHLAHSPLASAETVEGIESYERWPSPDWWDYSSLAEDCRDLSPYAVVNAGDRLDRTAQLKTMMYLRGVEQILMDLVLNPGIVDAILERVKAYYLAYNKRVFEAAGREIDIFMMGDDFGDQNGSLMDVATWRRFFKDGFKRFIELAHSYDIKVMHHTCGAVRELIPDFIECGLDILQSLQPRAKGMNLAELKREFGKDIAFHGSVDIQATLPRGTPEDVRKEVKDRMEAGKPGGGFVISTAHAIQPDVPMDNIRALIDAYRAYAAF